MAERIFKSKSFWCQDSTTSVYSINHAFLHDCPTSKIGFIISQKLLKIFPKKSGNMLKLGRTWLCILSIPSRFQQENWVGVLPAGICPLQPSSSGACQEKVFSYCSTGTTVLLRTHMHRCRILFCSWCSKEKTGKIGSVLSTHSPLKGEISELGSAVPGLLASLGIWAALVCSCSYLCGALALDWRRNKSADNFVAQPPKWTCKA